MRPKCLIIILKSLVYCSFRYKELISDRNTDLTDRKTCDKDIVTALSDLCNKMIEKRLSNHERYYKRGFLVFSGNLCAFEDKNLMFQSMIDTYSKNDSIYLFNITLKKSINKSSMINIISEQYARCCLEISRFERTNIAKKKNFASIKYQKIYKKESALYRLKSIKSAKDLFEFLKKEQKWNPSSKKTNLKYFYFLFTDILKSYERLIVYFCFDFYKIFELCGDTTLFVSVENTNSILQNFQNIFKPKNNEPSLISVFGYFFQPPSNLNYSQTENVQNNDNKNLTIDLVNTEIFKSDESSKLPLHYNISNLSDHFANLNPQIFNEWILPDLRVESSIEFYKPKILPTERLIKKLVFKISIPNFKDCNVSMVFRFNRYQLVSFSYKKYLQYKLIEQQKYSSMESLQEIFDSIIKDFD
ncbi:hypothetical protein CWI36_0079p0050 [Hamiltosporidium magnivora]|uniref:Uncharacterized protein n=1 Tax=Hamiltosporidium magnivora TaxID=148818 RepID=A0A4Q9LKY8_9MICR|nr:hypothetical protein CWI36_0079p0050 [Hamiltosporidium magnivora]